MISSSNNRTLAAEHMSTAKLGIFLVIAKQITVKFP